MMEFGNILGIGAIQDNFATQTSPSVGAACW
jgi:hypothetical protein